MANRKKKGETDQTTEEGVALLPPPTSPGDEAPPDANGTPETNGSLADPSPPAASRRPAASWKYPAAAGVTVEVALWPHTIRLQSGDEIEVFNATITRNYKDQQGQWQKGGSFRVAEIPVLIHALTRAHAFALDAREQNCPI